MGNRGAIFFDGKTESQTPAYPVQAVDSTAFGDCFAGSLAVGLSEGKSLAAAAEFASAATIISVIHAGAQPSLPRREEVTEFMNQRNGSK
jgi:ribokinase